MPITQNPPPPPPPDLWDDWIRVAQAEQLEWSAVPSSTTLGRFVSPAGENAYLYLSAITGRMAATFSTGMHTGRIELLITEDDANIALECDVYPTASTDVSFNGKDHAFRPALDDVPVVRAREA